METGRGDAAAATWSVPAEADRPRRERSGGGGSSETGAFRAAAGYEKSTTRLRRSGGMKSRMTAVWKIKSFARRVKIRPDRSKASTIFAASPLRHHAISVTNQLL